MKMKPGDIVTVKVAGKSFETIIDEEGVQRFRKNNLISFIASSGRVGLADLAVAYTAGLFTREEYMLFYMGMGYTVSGLFELSFFQNLEVENPLWKKPKKKK